VAVLNFFSSTNDTTFLHEPDTRYGEHRARSKFIFFESPFFSFSEGASLLQGGVEKKGLSSGRPVAVGFSTLRLFDMDSYIVVNVGWCRKRKMTKSLPLSFLE